MNSINPSLPPINSGNMYISVAKEENKQQTASDTFTKNTAQGSDPGLITKSSLSNIGTIRSESPINIEQTASKAMESASKVASSLVSGPAGSVAGVTVDQLLKHKDDINKGFKLTEDYISGYYQRRVEPYLSKPSYTPSDDQHLYRGMLLSVEDLANILENGLETKFNTWQSVGGKGVYFSSSKTEADHYIFQSSRKDGIGVMVEVEKGDFAHDVPDPVYNSTQTIYKADDDVPKEKITNIYIRGEYGFDSLSRIIEKAEKGEIKPNTKWVSQFNTIRM